MKKWFYSLWHTKLVHKGDETREQSVRLQRRGGLYFLRVRVPHELRPIIGRREIRRALKTSDRADAMQRVRVASVEVDAEFAAARRKLKPEAVASLSEAEIRHLVGVWFHGQERAAVDAYRKTAPDDRQDIVAALSVDGRRLIDAVEDPAVQDVANMLLADQGITLQQGSRDWWHVVEMVNRLARTVRNFYAPTVSTICCVTTCMCAGRPRIAKRT